MSASLSPQRPPRTPRIPDMSDGQPPPALEYAPKPTRPDPPPERARQRGGAEDHQLALTISGPCTPRALHSEGTSITAPKPNKTQPPHPPNTPPPNTNNNPNNHTNKPTNHHPNHTPTQPTNIEGGKSGGLRGVLKGDGWCHGTPPPPHTPRGRWGGLAGLGTASPPRRRPSPSAAGPPRRPAVCLVRASLPPPALARPATPGCVACLPLCDGARLSALLFGFPILPARRCCRPRPRPAAGRLLGRWCPASTPSPSIRPPYFASRPRAPPPFRGRPSG